MTSAGTVLLCPDCDDPLRFAFRDTSGTGAHKRGDHFNTVPDTDHYLCLGCAKAWKQRLDGPLTPDIVGTLAFFTCKHHDCARQLDVTRASSESEDDSLVCAAGHHFALRTIAEGSLTLVET